MTLQVHGPRAGSTGRGLITCAGLPAQEASSSAESMALDTLELRQFTQA